MNDAACTGSQNADKFLSPSMPEIFRLQRLATEVDEQGIERFALPGHEQLGDGFRLDGCGRSGCETTSHEDTSEDCARFLLLLYGDAAESESGPDREPPRRGNSPRGGGSQEPRFPESRRICYTPGVVSGN